MNWNQHPSGKMKIKVECDPNCSTYDEDCSPGGGGPPGGGGGPAPTPDTHLTFHYPGTAECKDTNMPRFFGSDPDITDSEPNGDTAYYGVDIDHEHVIVGVGMTKDVKLRTGIDGVFIKQGWW